ncbi:hypothetical protein KY332_04105 [Candidatus Woesearchaeota archaeon]|nr:hypothetical protein [Candidatus Woesearchaeota archaeon]
MKTHYLIGIIAVILLLCLAGCKNAGEVVENETVEEEVSGAVTAEESEDVDVKDLIKELSEEAGLDTEEEVVSTGSTIVIENFRGTPEDLDIKAGTTVTWENKMTFMNIIIILPQKNDSNKYDTRWINDLVELWIDESYSYTFEEAGDYKWGSKTKFDKTYGFITVTE